MDAKRRKQLMQEYANRKPEMGVISFHAVPRGEKFLGISKDTKADLNSNRFKLKANWHPNPDLQALWNQHGESHFALSVVQVLEYEDPKADHSEELEKLLEQCLKADNSARRISK